MNVTSGELSSSYMIAYRTYFQRCNDYCFCSGYSHFPVSKISKPQTNAMYITEFIQRDGCMDLELDQCLATEHAFANLANDILAVLLAHQDNTATTLAHTAKTTKTVNEVNRGVGNMV